ncbi:MAG: pyridoxine 5'-phosphate synthase [Verrucomicrobium sp.]|nr:pyridoxine 5'-phosphate synthase [Verrucomicrobium sp.]
MPVLGVNVDHIATLRQARYRDDLKSPLAEPDPVTLARTAEKAGAQGITVHLREDRRHIQEIDVRRLRREAKTSLNLEMAVTPAMVAFALRLRPDEACLVPESREEVTTEGGLDVVGREKAVADAVRKLSKAGVEVSLFIDPQPAQIEAAARVGAPCIELHTGAYANATTPAKVRAALERQKKAAALAKSLGLRVNAGHGLNYKNVPPFLKAVPGLHTLNIGHSIVSRALAVGFGPAVAEMAALLRK